MNQLPRPVTTGNYSRIESALSAADRGGTSSIRFHDCSHNASMTILRDLKEMVSFKSGRLDSWKVKDRQKISSLNVKFLQDCFYPGQMFDRVYSVRKIVLFMPNSRFLAPIWNNLFALSIPNLLQILFYTISDCFHFRLLVLGSHI
jgi:hypothetical protein